MSRLGPDDGKSRDRGNRILKKGTAHGIREAVRGRNKAVKDAELFLEVDDEGMSVPHHVVPEPRVVVVMYKRMSPLSMEDLVDAW